MAENGLDENGRPECAVEGCAGLGRPQVCLYDGRYHHHGCIHYESATHMPSGTALSFRPGWWRWICDGHYQVLKNEHDAVLVSRAASA